MSDKPVKGINYTAIGVSFLCHDGKGNYLMHKRSEQCRDEHGTWDFGGGGLKFGEYIEDGLLREIHEEFGVAPVKHTFLGFRQIHRTHEGKPTHWINFYYLAELNRPDVINNEPHKHDELRWVTLDNMPQPLHSALMATVEEFRDKLV